MTTPADAPRNGSISARMSDRLRTRSALGRRWTATKDDLRRRHIPLHWTSLIWVVSMACLLMLFTTGLFLMFFYVPSGDLITYQGAYRNLHGAEVSRAFESTMRITFEVPGGLLLRQAHHWAGLLLLASIVTQLAVTFFTGGFRRPRRLAWVLLFLIFIVALVGGWSGYALPDDTLSGSGLRIVQGIVLGIPVVGTWLSMLLFGGEFPGTIIQQLYPIHVAVVPILLIALVAARIRSAWVHKPVQFAGPGRTEENVVGVPILPAAIARAGGLLSIVMGVLMLMAATVTVSPIWLHGPAAPGDASAGSQPDWYTGFLDGALRLVPPGWEVEWADRTWTFAILVPLAVVGGYFALMLLYPFLEDWIVGDTSDHHLLDRPRNVATRTGIGVAGIVFYGVLWAAGSIDLAATQFSLSIEGLVAFLQVSLLAGPLLAFIITRRVCLALQKKDREIALHGFETGRIVRLPGGEYLEVHEPVNQYQRWRLVSFNDQAPYDPSPEAGGRPTAIQRLRGALSRFFFEDRIRPLTPGELDTAASPRAGLPPRAPE